MPLFRPESFRTLDGLYGDVQVVPSVSWRIVGFFLLASLTVAAIFLSLGSHSSLTIVRGEIRKNDGALPAGTPIEAMLDVPSDAASLIQPGQSIHIAVDAFPYETFGTIKARLRTVSRATVPATGSDGRSRDVFIVTASLARETIAAYGQAQPLRPGMTVSARIETGRRSLARWLFDPTVAVARR